MLTEISLPLAPGWADRIKARDASQAKRPRADDIHMGTTVATKSKWKSRAVLRLIEPGSSVDCAHCGERVKFQARLRLQQVICNVYTRNVWERVEHYHSGCYELAGNPYGEPKE